MKKIVLTFGLISGAVMAVMMYGTLPFSEKIGFDRALIVGYTTIILGFMLVFFGIRSYRENVNDGYITFGRAFAVGILITLIACVCYVVAWQILYFNFMPDHLDKYISYSIEKARAAGATPQELDAQVKEMESFKAMYNGNLLINFAFTFLEPFPVGLVVTLISSLILRKARPAATEPVRA